MPHHPIDGAPGVNPPPTMRRFRIFQHNGVWWVIDRQRRTTRTYPSWAEAVVRLRARDAIRPTKETA